MLITTLIKYLSMSDIFLFCGKRHVMFATWQKFCHLVSKVRLSSMIYHHVEKARFLFPYNGDDVTGLKRRAIFATSSSCYEVVTNACYLCHLAKMFSLDGESHGIFFHMGKILSDKCIGYIIVVMRSKRCQIF